MLKRLVSLQFNKFYPITFSLTKRVVNGLIMYCCCKGSGVFGGTTPKRFHPIHSMRLLHDVPVTHKMADFGGKREISQSASNVLFGL